MQSSMEGKYRVLQRNVTGEHSQIRELGKACSKKVIFQLFDPIWLHWEILNIMALNKRIKP